MLGKIKPLLRKILGTAPTQLPSGITYIGSKLPKLTIGTESYINGCRIYCWDSRINISIGKYCSFADDLTIIAGGEHDIDWVSTFPFIDRWSLSSLENLKKPRFKGNIEIGNDVWIGHGVTILSGVRIADGAVIASGSVVVKDIPPYSVAAGVPAKPIKSRFNEHIIQELLKISWWDWPKNKIQDNIELMTSPEEFIIAHSKK